MARAPHVFTISPGVNFLETFAQQLIDGHIVDVIKPPLDPLALSSATIFVPTRRAARALREELIRKLAGPALLLPKIVPLGHMDSIETSLLFETDMPVDGIPDAMTPIERRLTLMQLVHKWALQLGTAITRYENGAIQTDGREPLLVAQAPAQAWHLAGDLASLIDEMIVEDADWTRLERLAPEDFDRYWLITIDFLKIASQFWPQIRDQRGLIDAAMRQKLLVDHEIARLQKANPQHPVIAVGSTGTNRATARLLAAIARLENGAVVLPGLDLTLDDEAWTLIDGDKSRKIEPAAGHPQAALHRLLPILEIERRGVFERGRPDLALTMRQRLLTEAFRPADTTDSWPSFLSQQRPEDLASALQDISMVIASDEREEALTLALAMRQALHEDQEKTIALVTPDRALARRVRAELRRWKIEIDDSGGEPLASSPYGVLARLALGCADQACMPVEWLALLAHPSVRLGYPRAELERLTALLEMGVLRGVSHERDRPLDMVATARLMAADPYAHPACKRISDRDWDQLLQLVERLCAALKPLHDRPHATSLKDCIEQHRICLSLLVQDEHGPQPAFDESYDAFEQAFGEIALKASAEPTFHLSDYAALADFIMRETIVRGPARAHPRLKILGLLEARLIHADLMIVAGLDETIWPPQVETGAFLNRPMRAELGLTPPERRIGQTAHDFVQALGTRHVVLSRAVKRGGAPTVPSRFLQRFEALVGDAFAPAKKRGEALIHLARQMDRADASRSQPRPEPKPDLDLRPTTLSITEIETLRRDPYSIYAKHILKILPLEDLDAEPSAREAGTQLHDIFAEFVKRHEKGPLPQNAREELLALGEEKLALLMQDPNYRAFNWPRVEMGLQEWLSWEETRRAELVDSQVEQSGKLAIPLEDQSIFVLRGKADRIDRLTTNEAEIIDYKSGTISSKDMIKVGFAPQLPLEVKMVESGAFEAIGPIPVRNALHVKIGGKDPLKPESIAKPGDFRDVVESNFSGLQVLLNQFRDVTTPYLARPFPQYASRFGRYDHLSRVKEWSAGGGDGGEA